MGQVPSNGTPVVVPRHGIWEMHGGQEEETCRLIHDMLVSRHNGTAGIGFTHIPADVDRLANKTKYAQELFPTAGLSCLASDDRDAYKQDSLSPGQMFMAVIAVWSALMGRTVFYVARTQLLGSRVSPVFSVQGCRSGPTR